MLSKMKIGIIGCGNMGEALLKGLLRNLKRRNVIAGDKRASRSSYIGRRYRVSCVNNILEIARKSDIIIVSVKPQDIDGVLSELGGCVNVNQLVISIAAGIRTVRIERYLKGVPVIRVMPNMPALIGEGISALAKGRLAKGAHIKKAEFIMGLIGDTVRVDESAIDAVTALSGSGPAYFFYFIDALIKAGIRQGLEKNLSAKLALKTALGAGKLIQSSDLSAEALIEKVASKGGTTEAALSVFEKRGVRKIIGDAVKAAAKRSKELSRRS